VPAAAMSARSSGSARTRRKPSRISRHTPVGPADASGGSIARVLDQPTREQERERVEQDGERRAQQADKRAAEARADDLGACGGHLQLCVALDETVARDEPGQERQVRDVEEHAERAHEQGDHAEQLDRQEPEHARDGHEYEEPRASEIGRDEHGAP